MRKVSTTKPITVRFSLGEHQKLLDAAEVTGGNIADVLRKSWADYQQSQKHEELLLRLEQRLKHAVFEIIVAMTKADQIRQDQIRNNLKEKGIQW